MFNFSHKKMHSSVIFKGITHRLLEGETLMLDNFDTGEQQRKRDDMDKEKTLTELNRLSKQYMDDNYLVGKIKKDPTANCLYFSYQKSNGDTGRAALSFDPPNPTPKRGAVGHASRHGNKSLVHFKYMRGDMYFCCQDREYIEEGLVGQEFNTFEPIKAPDNNRVKELEGSLLRVYGMLSDGVGDTDVVAVNKMIEALNELRKITGGQ